MSQTATFSEMVSQGKVTYPAQVDEITKQTIFDWFQYRRVCDNDRFNIYFNRILNRDYARYQQQLRIEPGVAEYDWFVESYQESETRRTGDNKNNQTSKVSGTNSVSVTGTVSTTSTVHNTGSDITKNNTTDATANHSDVVFNGKDIHAPVGSTVKTDHAGKEITKQTGGSSEYVTDKHTLKPADHTLTRNGAIKTDNTGHSKSTNESRNISDDVTASDAVGIGKNMPMSIDAESVVSGVHPVVSVKQSSSEKQVNGVGGDVPDPTGQETVEVDANFKPVWKTASTMNENYGKQASRNSGFNKASGSSENGSTSTTSYNDYSENVRYDDTGKESGSSSHISRTAYGTFSMNGGTLEFSEGDGLKNERSFEGRSDTVTTTFNGNETNEQKNETKSDGTSTVKRTGDVTLQHGLTVDSQGTTKTTQTNGGKDDRTSDVNGTAHNESVDHAITTGRYELPSSVIEKAVSVIRTTCAFDWLRQQLEPCFMCIYDL